MKFKKRLLSFVLATLMLLTSVPVYAVENIPDVTSVEQENTSVQSTSDSVVVIAGSDFQNKSGDQAGASTVTSILTQMKNDYETADGLLFCGDYDQDTHNSQSETEKGIKYLQNAVSAQYGTLNTVLVQGNHDYPSSMLSGTGAHDSDAYGVYVLDEDDYPDSTGTSDGIQKLANQLGTYLTNKVNENYTKPVFVISHLPLHYSYRTYNNGNGAYAKYLFDVMNTAANAGLNIIFLFGHNHSSDHDSYLGGGSIFLKPGDSLWLAQPGNQKAKPVEHKLAFTYMNAGYVGYSEDDADNSLTMTAFEITDKAVTVTRYDVNGKHDLKSAGKYNATNDDSGYGYPVYSNVVKSPYTFSIAEIVSLSDKSTNVSVSAKGITSVNVSLKQGDSDSSLYSAYLTYDITVGGFVTGSTATVTVPVDEEFDSNRPVIVIDNGTIIATTSIENGYVTFTTNHFSEYSIAQYDASTAVSVSGNLISDELIQVTEQSGLINDPDNPHMYVIVANEGEDATLTNEKSGNGLKLVSGIDTNYVWYYSERGEGTPYFHYGYYNNTNDGEGWLKVSSSKGHASVGDDSNRVNNIVANADGTFYIYRDIDGKNRYLIRYNNATSMLAGSIDKNDNKLSRWKIYEVISGSGSVVTLSVSPNASTILVGNTGKFTPQVTVADEITSNYDITWTTSDSSVATVSNGVVTGLKDGKVTITATLNSANNEKLQEPISVKLAVTVITKTVSSISLDKLNGSVERGSDLDTETGAIMTITYDDGTVETKPVTLDMLSGSFDVKKNGTYDGLNVSYGNQTINNFTLEVTNVSGNDYPEYPNGGSVSVDKTADAKYLQQTGVVEVELSTAGIPVEKGADVIIMLDTSSSMERNQVEGSSKTRAEVLEESLEDLIEKLQSNGPNGKPLDIRAAIADFNGFYSDAKSPYYWNENDKLVQWGSYTGESKAQVYTGSNRLNASAFVDVQNLDGSQIADALDYTSGTNYDYAFDAIYQLAHAIKQQNENNEEERDLYVIFMSDGAPYQYNYYQSSSQTMWNDWLLGTIEDSNYADSANKNYYNLIDGIHKHRMAEAIKGDIDEKYTVIRKNLTGFESVSATPAANGDPTMYDIPGLGANMYSIAFCPAIDDKTSKESMIEVIKNIASPDTSNITHYYEVNSANELTNAFNIIGNEIRYAATDAYFLDQMGESFNLQMASAINKRNEAGMVESINLKDLPGAIEPQIQVKSYNIYTKSDFDNNKCDADQIGERYGAPTVIETITFSDDGLNAYSDLIESGRRNILVDGVITAKNFWYNTTLSAKTITLADGMKYSLPAETFYWSIGTVNEIEYALSYYVYLEGSMEGNRQAGSYNTNEYAILNYKNWLGNDAHQDTTSPSVGWLTANVSYAFYLVDHDGNPIVNQTTGETGSFYNAVKITSPVLFQEIRLNNLDKINTIQAASAAVLPEGFELYDDTASYKVVILSEDGRGSWTITHDSNKVQSSYVTGHYGTTATNEPLVTSDNTVTGLENYKLITNYDYTHTTVWFAVVWNIGTIPDTVVIDYGLPVDIGVLENDMFGENGTLIGVGGTAHKPNGDYTESDSLDFGNTYKAGFGTAKLYGEEIRYTPDNTMQRNTYDEFTYEVEYMKVNSARVELQYYYGDVTVIPATTVYYEDNYVTTNNGTVKEGEDETLGVWTSVGITIANATQAEDRPGGHSLPSIDADNVYGYDGTYANCSTYSLGSAQKVTVGAANNTTNGGTWPTAEFVFAGTGFDIVSVTNGNTGLVNVKVLSADGSKQIKSWLVDTYYGYSFDAEKGEWIVTENPDTLYQIPIIKGEGFEYGTYKVVITPMYSTAFDHTSSGSYDFYLDAIRIYDPVDPEILESTDTTVKDAYLADKEYNTDYAELRNLLIQASDFKANEDVRTVEGIVFVDGYGDTADIAEYTNAGPNNEVYLKSGQAIAFDIWSTDKPESLQIGVKTVHGDSGVMALGNTQTAVMATREFDTATDMYYEISQHLTWTDAKNDQGYYVTKYPVIMTNVTEESVDSIISLTNLKWTFAENASNPDGDGPTRLVTEEVQTLSLRSTIETASMVYTALRRMFVPEPEVEVFTPEQFEVSLNKDTAKIGGKIKITVKTSDDVESIRINGKEYTDYSSKKTSGVRTWKIDYIVENQADTSITIGAYNADHVSSEVIENTIGIKGK